VPDIIPPVEIEKELCKRSLHEFVIHAWDTIEPDTKFVDGWHIEMICNYLENLVSGNIRNLIINIPPRHMKSLMVNVLFPAWLWTFKPETKFLFSSYAEDLTIRDSQLCRKLITSEWYQKRWPLHLEKDQNRKDRFTNEKGGVRLSVSVGGGAMGEGGDYVIVDDPLQAADANSEAKRNYVNDWWSNTMSTRLNNPRTGRKVVIMQRLHEDDLTGYLLRGKERYELLCLPAEYEGNRYDSTIGLSDPRKVQNELLWPGQFNQDAIDSLKNQLSELGVAGQLQQRPSPVAGNIFKKDWFQSRYLNTDVVARYISWDTALSVSEEAARTSWVVGELTSDYRLFIREVGFDKLDFPALEAKIKEVANKYRFELRGVIIESKASGISVLQTLSQSQETWLAELLVPFTPTVDKVTRAFNASLWCEKSCIELPPPSEEYNWLFNFEEELFSFPNSKYKDSTDAFNQLVLYLENYLSEGYRTRIGIGEK
jgi:predicted phage terminase large subunit-like protein